MSGMPSLNGASNFQPQFSGKRSCSSILEIDSWMLGKIQAISQAELLNLGPRALLSLEAGM